MIFCYRTKNDSSEQINRKYHFIPLNNETIVRNKQLMAPKGKGEIHVV